MEHVEVLRELRGRAEMDIRAAQGAAESRRPRARAAALDAAIAALSAPQSDDWVLVPREPSKAMVGAWNRTGPRFEDAYTAMLAAAPQPPAEAHCATCSCVPGMTPAVRFDATPAEKEGAVRDHLIRMGWTPPAEAQAQGGGEVVA